MKGAQISRIALKVRALFSSSTTLCRALLLGFRHREVLGTSTVYFPLMLHRPDKGFLEGLLKGFVHKGSMRALGFKGPCTCIAYCSVYWGLKVQKTLQGLPSSLNPKP